MRFDSDGRVIEHRLKAPYPAKPPWDHGPSDPYLTIVYAGSAEAGSYMHIAWPFPPLIIDLYAEYMVLHNSEMVRKAVRSGDSKPPGPSLIQACQRYRVKAMDQDRKEEMRTLAYSKTNHTPEEIDDLQDYCLKDDCWMGVRLFKAMRSRIDFRHATLRGAFMMEIERMRWHGIPIDMSTYGPVKERGGAIASSLRESLNKQLLVEARKIHGQMTNPQDKDALGRFLGGVVKDACRRGLEEQIEVYYQDVFKRRTMFALMRACKIPIPIDPKTRKFTCATRAVKGMIATHPLLKEYYEDKRMIDAVKNLQLEIGADNRNRSWLNPFGTKTGRNNPSTNRYVFGLPHTMRSFIKPDRPGWAIATVDVGCRGSRHCRRLVR